MVRHVLSVVTVLAGAAMAALVAAPAAVPRADAHDERTVPGFGTARPRAVYGPGTEAELAARVERDPYRAIFLEAHARHEARRLSRTPGDPDRFAQKDMARAARWLAFTYAIDRTVIDGEVVPFPSEAARRATGEIVEELLLGAYNRSRFAVPPPLGGWDRDIDTAGEILQWSGAFDTMLGAGFDFDGTDDAIATILIDATSELYRNYTRPETAGGVADLHQNNHRSKSGAAMATAAVVLAEYAPDPADDPDGSRDPLAWWDYGTTLVDEMLRFVLVTGDGAYSEGPHYQRFTIQSIAPYVGMWERVLGDESWTTGDGRVVPALHTTPRFGFMQDWMLDLTLPDGTLAPIDDANTHEAYYFGALPPLPNQDAYAWRWANAAPPYAQEGSVDLAVDSIVAYDDSVVPQEPGGSPTSFWYDGGNAVFRSDWSADATLVIAQGEGITASLFGRDSTGAGRAPQSHEHMEPGSFLLHAEGSTLVLDPGYFTFGTHGQVLEARDHNMVLVNGAGPTAMLANSFAWRADPFGPPPQDGFASIHSTLDTDRLDSAIVTTRYGEAGGGTDIELHRRFLFVDDRYLVVADEIVPHGAEQVELDWLLHGNGGGTSGGTYTARSNGGTWTHGDARLTTAIATSAGAPAISSRIEEHEAPTARRRELTHEAQYATIATSGPVRAVQVLVPSPLGAGAPTISTSTTDDGSILATIDDPAAGRTASVSWTAAGLTVLDDASDGDDPVAFSTGDSVDTGSATLTAPGAAATTLAATADGGWEAAAIDPAHSLFLAGVGAGAADGACGALVEGDRVRLDPGGSPRVRWLPTVTDARPSAVARVGVERAAVGSEIQLDGRGSCDPAGDSLTPRWELVAAPRGSAWQLAGTDSWTPRLAVDAAGTFRVRLTVTDAAGNASDPVDVVVAGGDRCADERDDDLDGRFDAADPDCDGAPPDPTNDAVGIIVPGSYAGALTAPADTARVERGADGRPRSIAMVRADGDKAMGVLARIDHASDEATALVLLVDTEAGQLTLRPWRGRVVEVATGLLVGVDDASGTIWVVADRPT